MVVTLSFTLGDATSILTSKTGEPFIQVFYNATESKPAVNTMVAIIIILLCSCCFSEVATASCQL
jgi:choline transport protein